MGEEVGENAMSNQPYRLREQVHLGRLKIKQTEGRSLPINPHRDCQYAVKIVKEREQQRVAMANLRLEEPKANPSSSSSS